LQNGTYYITYNVQDSQYYIFRTIYFFQYIYFVANFIDYILKKLKPTDFFINK